MSEEKSKLLCQCPKQSSETKKIYVTLCGHRVICRTLITNENFNTRSFWCVKSKIEAHNRGYVVREEKKKKTTNMLYCGHLWMPEKVHIAHKFQRTLALFHNLISQL